MQTIILGGGHLGRAIATVAAGRGERIPIIGHPPDGRHDPVGLEQADLLIDATHPDAVAANVDAGLEAGIRRFVIATTGWAATRPTVDRRLRRRDAAAVVSANFSLGVALFVRVVDRASELFGGAGGYDPYLIEWHRRTKADRPSGTALDLAARIVDRHPGLRDADDLEMVSVRSGASPGMHLVAFDAPGETIELRLTARDRSAYATGVLAAADWLRRGQRAPGIHPFDPVVDELLVERRSAA